MADPFRAQYRPLTAEETAAIARVKAMAGDLWTAIEALPNVRERALARTKVEEAVMWAVKAVTG